MSRATSLDREFATSLKRVREAAGLSQSALARSAGIPNPQVRYSRIETGESPATISEALRLADALGVSLEDLAKGLPSAGIGCAVCTAILPTLRSVTSAIESRATGGDER